jgi:hypothetical protein
MGVSAYGSATWNDLAEIRQPERYRRGIRCRLLAHDPTGA